MLLFALDIGKLRPIAGTEFIEKVMICDAPECEAMQPLALPYFSTRYAAVAPDSQDLRIRIKQGVPATEPMALYFPKLSDDLQVAVNGQTVFVNPAAHRLWNTPLLVPIPQEFLQHPDIDLALTLSGPAAEGLDLQPFYFGPYAILSPYQAWRAFFGQGLARFGFGLVMILGSALLILWVYRRAEKEYLWLGVACFVIAPTLVHYGYSLPPIPYQLWTLLWVLCPSLYALLILKFLRAFLGLPANLPERAHSAALAVTSTVILLSPPDFAFPLSMWANLVINVPSTFSALSTFWMNRSLSNRADLRVIYGCMITSVVLGIYALYLHLSPAPLRTMHLFHLTPLVMSFACLWMILSRLIQSLHNFEQLTETLSDTVNQKTAALEASFTALAEVKRREAIAEERDRIMLDLHDGIGGQLVSTLAYMQSNAVGDDKVRRALEDALRDLALMLDSMENHDSLVTLLGMLRTRLEGLLSEHGIEFDWQVHDEPELPNPGPSQSLHLARIVQEAITNVIKHAQADTITVYVDKTTIRISDNGKGFDLSEQAAREHPSNGIANMKRRSDTLGTYLSIESDPNGTHICLRLKD